MEVNNTDTNIIGDWRKELKEYFKDPKSRVPYEVKAQAQNFDLLDGELYRKRVYGLLLGCFLSQKT